MQYRKKYEKICNSKTSSGSQLSYFAFLSSQDANVISYEVRRLIIAWR